MTRAKMSLLLFSVIAAVWFFIPAQYSHAESATTEMKTFSSSSDMNSPQADTEYQFKREQSETQLNALPGTEERKTEVETERRSDSDLAPPATSEYQFKSEHRETTQVAPPTVVERDRTIVERDASPPPSEGRLQAWWHRNLHGDD